MKTAPDVIDWTASMASKGGRWRPLGYDYMNRRVQKKVSHRDGTAWVLDDDLRFVWDGWNLVMVIKHTEASGQNPATDTVTRKYTWGLDLSGLNGNPSVNGIHGAGGIGGSLAVEETATSGSPSYWFFYDGNGNVGQLVKASDQTTAARYEYDPYGNTIVKAGDYADANPYRFSTKWFDAETNLYYNDNRYYIPRLGRWGSPDPIEEQGGLNLYAYVQNEPTGLIDPHGLRARCGDVECACACGKAKTALYGDSETAKAIIEAGFGAGATGCVTLADGVHCTEPCSDIPAMHSPAGHKILNHECCHVCDFRFPLAGPLLYAIGAIADNCDQRPVQSSILPLPPSTQPGPPSTQPRPPSTRPGPPGTQPSPPGTRPSPPRTPRVVAGARFASVSAWGGCR